jgi:hypothetical protein
MEAELIQKEEISNLSFKENSKVSQHPELVKSY